MEKQNKQEIKSHSLISEFIPYEQALELKELGFDEPCFGWYQDKTLRIDVNANQSIKFHEHLGRFKGCFLAPTFSQAFRWFREKHILHAEPYTIDMGKIEYSFCIRDLYSEKYIYDNFKGAGNSYWGTFDTYEEAELACLKKLIEILKQPKKD